MGNGNYAFIRNNNLKMGQANNSYRHNERVNKNYANDSIDRSKSHLNYHFLQPQGTYDQEFWRIREENNYKGNLRLQGSKQSNVMCEFIIDVNKDWFDKIGEERTKQYFKDSYEFVKNKVGEKNVISAVVHVDEGHPHMHVVYVPVVKAKNSKGQETERVNCSKFWEGKDSYRRLQDDFYNHTQKMGYKDLQRGESVELTQREHLSVDEFKAEQSKQKQVELERLKDIETEIAPPEKKIYLPKDIENIKDLVKAANLKKRELTYENKQLKEQVLKLNNKLVESKKLTRHSETLEKENKAFKFKNKAFEEYLKNTPSAKAEVLNYIKYIDALSKEREKMAHYKQKYLECTSKIKDSEKIRSSYQTQLNQESHSLKDMLGRKETVELLEKKIEQLKIQREELGGIKNILKVKDRKSLDEHIQLGEKRLNEFKNNLEHEYNTSFDRIDNKIQEVKFNLESAEYNVNRQKQFIEELQVEQGKAMLNYKYLSTKSSFYKDHEREYVRADSDSIQAGFMEELALNKLSKRDRELIKERLPEKYHEAFKNVFEHQNTYTKSQSFGLER